MSNRPRRQYAVSSLRVVVRLAAHDIFRAMLAEEKSLDLRMLQSIPVILSISSTLSCLEPRKIQE